MRKIYLKGMIGCCSLFCAMGASEASTITDNFEFFNASSVVASGSFSYSSSLSGDLKYSDLNSFSITVAGASYDINFVKSLSPASGDFVYFDYSTVSKSFVPGSVSGTYWDPVSSSYVTGTFSALLAATGFAAAGGTPLTYGFFFDPLFALGVPGADGLYSEYSTKTTGQLATSLVVTPVPETSTWVMMLLGFSCLGFAYRRKSRPSIA